MEVVSGEWWHCSLGGGRAHLARGARVALRVVRHLGLQLDKRSRSSLLVTDDVQSFPVHGAVFIALVEQRARIVMALARWHGHSEPG